MQPQKLLRVLCFHGYTQNGVTLKNKIGSTRKVLRTHCEFIFVDAPYLILDERSDQRSWWITKEEKPSASMRYEGLSRSFREISRALIDHFPVDGLFGFSQGSTMAAIFLGTLQPFDMFSLQGFVEQLQKGGRDFKFLEGDMWTEEDCQELLHHFSPKFSLLVSGFIPRDLVLVEELLPNQISLCRTFHVYGRNDTLVDNTRTIDLANRFSRDPVLFSHPGGHVVPTGTGDYKVELLKFMADFEC